MPTTRIIARKEYRNGNWGMQTASLAYTGDKGAPWVVSSYDHWAHRTLADAKAHYRRIGASA